MAICNGKSKQSFYLLLCILGAIISAEINFLNLDSAAALNTKSSFCKSMLIEVKNLDVSGRALFEKYSRDFAVARESGKVEDNLIQTKTLLELFENDRSVYLRTLEGKKCLTKTETAIVEESLANATADVVSVKAWIDVQTGIPGQNYYKSYMDLPKYLSTPGRWKFCEKKGSKYKSLNCEIYEGKLRWIDKARASDSSTTPTWPTDFINGQVNMIEAKLRIANYFEKNSLAASTNGAASVDFFKRTSYPGLFDFNSEAKLTACKNFAELQDKAGSYKIKYVVNVDGIKLDPDWVLTDASRGEQIVNKKFKGQVFVVPVRIDISQNDWNDPGTWQLRHVAILEGEVFRFSAC